MAYRLIYVTPMSGKYFLECSLLGKCGKISKNRCISSGYGRIEEIPHGVLQPDWGL